MSPPSSTCPKILRSSPCRPSHPSSTPSRTSGNTCAIIGSPTGSSPTMKTSSIIAVSIGTSWLNARGSSCRLERGDGPMGRTFRDLVEAGAGEAQHAERIGDPSLLHRRVHPREPIESALDETQDWRQEGAPSLEEVGRKAKPEAGVNPAPDCR